MSRSADMTQDAPVAVERRMSLYVAETLGGEWRGRPLSGRRSDVSRRVIGSAASRWPIAFRRTTAGATSRAAHDGPTGSRADAAVPGPRDHRTGRRRRHLRFPCRMRLVRRGVFRVRQFVLTSFAAERPLLEEVAALMRASAFSSPTTARRSTRRSSTRAFLFHRLTTPLAGLPTHRHAASGAATVARRRRGAIVPAVAEQGSLAMCGRAMCQASRSLPGTSISCARRRTSAEGVLEHNRLDLVLWRCSRRERGSCSRGSPAAASTAREALGIGTVVRAVGDGRRTHWPATARAVRHGPGRVRGGALRARRAVTPDRAATRWQQRLGSACSTFPTVRRAFDP